jgi:hypothetical protein
VVFPAPWWSTTVLRHGAGGTVTVVLHHGVTTTVLAPWCRGAGANCTHVLAVTHCGVSSSVVDYHGAPAPWWITTVLIDGLTLAVGLLRPITRL